ncbi:hypothetical protein HD554DRAFT_2035088 [Boletus coccyginus]|nr:hypothetical protein HD554DRAFT_2035088 [Boletus coccyginus]
MNRKTISKEEAANEEVESKKTKKRLARSSIMQAINSGAKSKKSAVEKQPLVKNDWNSSGNNSKMVVQLIAGEEIDAEKRQECHSSKQKHSWTMHHNGSSRKKKHSVIAGTKIWSMQFGQLHTYISNWVIKLCNVDINKIHDDETLGAWHRLINMADPHASKILEYILLLRLIVKLEKENGHFQDAMCMIGKENRQFMV